MCDDAERKEYKTIRKGGGELQMRLSYNGYEINYEFIIREALYVLYIYIFFFLSLSTQSINANILVSCVYRLPVSCSNQNYISSTQLPI